MLKFPFLSWFSAFRMICAFHVRCTVLIKAPEGNCENRLMLLTFFLTGQVETDRKQTFLIFVHLTGRSFRCHVVNQNIARRLNKTRPIRNNKRFMRQHLF